MALRRSRDRRRTIVLTRGSVKNSYLPLTGILDFFPQEAIGGRSTQQVARRPIVLSFGLGEPITTDIVEGKQIFRRRGWVRRFLRAHSLKDGDRVVIEETSPYRYHLYPEPTTTRSGNGDREETRLALALEQEDDGRWICEIVDLPGALAYGRTPEEATVRAKALALRIIADRLEHAEAAPKGPNISFARA